MSKKHKTETHSKAQTFPRPKQATRLQPKVKTARVKSKK